MMVQILEETNPLVVALLSFFGGVLSLLVTIIVASMNIRGVQSQAIDEISAGASNLLQEYRTLRESDQQRIRDLEHRLSELEAWKSSVDDFIIPLLEGAHQLKDQIISLEAAPVYYPPDLSEWLDRISSHKSKPLPNQNNPSKGD